MSNHRIIRVDDLHQAWLELERRLLTAVVEWRELTFIGTPGEVNGVPITRTFQAVLDDWIILVVESRELTRTLFRGAASNLAGSIIYLPPEVTEVLCSRAKIALAKGGEAA